MSLTQQLKAQAIALGFDLVGVTPAQNAPGYGRLQEWLTRGYAGGMSYFASRLSAYEHPKSVLPDVKSVVVVTMNYATKPPELVGPGQGRVSRYAWGSDYHDVIRERLKRLGTWLVEHSIHATTRAVVDTAPLLERDFAVLAGLGWIGKNTLVINPLRGSYFFLAALLTNVELEFDHPFRTDHCGTCTACLDACPTQALTEPGVLDARRCISYLTIEHRGEIAAELRTGLEDWLFGCDVCQEVCPWNRFSVESAEATFAPRAEHDPVDLVELFTLSDAQLRDKFRGTPLSRAKPQGILRNAAMVLGNQHNSASIPALQLGLTHADTEVQSSCAWALTQIENAKGRAQAE